jgi:hypothetical protein
LFSDKLSYYIIIFKSLWKILFSSLSSRSVRQFKLQSTNLVRLFAAHASEKRIFENNLSVKMFSMLPKSVAGCRGFVKASSISTSICLSKALPATKTAWHYVAGCSSNVLSNRSYATSVVTQTSQGKKEPEKSVFISQSNDIYTNLALEDWILNSKNFDFENHRILLLYRNAPCVVFGSFQNPWTEVDLALAQEYDLPVVRRKSGGGCVYHDLGNLNCTFFSSDKTFDVKNSPIPNLEMICRALKREFGIDGVVTPNKDITVNGRKVRTLWSHYLFVIILE